MEGNPSRAVWLYLAKGYSPPPQLQHPRPLSAPVTCTHLTVSKRILPNVIKTKRCRSRARKLPGIWVLCRHGLYKRIAGRLIVRNLGDLLREFDWAGRLKNTNNKNGIVGRTKYCLPRCWVTADQTKQSTSFLATTRDDISSQLMLGAALPIAFIVLLVPSISCVFEAHIEMTSDMQS